VLICLPLMACTFVERYNQVSQTDQQFCVLPNYFGSCHTVHFKLPRKLHLMVTFLVICVKRFLQVAADAEGLVGLIER